MPLAPTRSIPFRMGARSRGLAWTCFCLTVLACGGRDASPAALVVTIDTIAGVPHISNAGPAPAWNAEPVFAVGSVDGAVQFGRVMGIAADRDGTVYVADGMESRVLVFDSTGALVTTFGRQGEGPGEFRDLYAVALLGDTIVTLDPRAARIGLFDRNGGWLGLWRHQALSGDVRLEGVASDEIYNPIVIPRERTIDRAYVRITHAGPTDTLVLPPRDDRAASSTITCEGADGGIHFNSNPFAGREFVRAAPGARVLLAWTADYRLAVLDSGLDTVRVIERLAPPVPVPDSAWAAYLDEFRSWFDGIPSPRCQGRAEPQRPASYPAIREIVFDPEGRLWVEAYTADGFTFDVFDLDGRLLGSARVPERDTAVRPYARGDRFYVVTADRLGVQRVEAFRLR